MCCHAETLCIYRQAEATTCDCRKSKRLVRIVFTLCRNSVLIPAIQQPWPFIHSFQQFIPAFIPPFIPAIQQPWPFHSIHSFIPAIHSSIHSTIHSSNPAAMTISLKKSQFEWVPSGKTFYDMGTASGNLHPHDFLFPKLPKFWKTNGSVETAVVESGCGCITRAPAATSQIR